MIKHKHASTKELLLTPSLCKTEISETLLPKKEYGKIIKKQNHNKGRKKKEKVGGVRDEERKGDRKAVKRPYISDRKLFFPPRG